MRRTLLSLAVLRCAHAFHGGPTVPRRGLLAAVRNVDVPSDGDATTDQYSALRVSELRELLRRRGEARLSGLTKPRLLERLRMSLAAEAADADIVAKSTACVCRARARSSSAFRGGACARVPSRALSARAHARVHQVCRGSRGDVAAARGGRRGGARQR